jgi:hypothetical protein
MQSVRPDQSRQLGALQTSVDVPVAHRAQMQTFLCASTGIDARALGLIVAVMHQHDSGSRPAATAHSLGSPHRGHLVVSFGSGSSVI